MRTLLAAPLMWCFVCVAADGQETGYQREVNVRAETRLDWIFAVSNQSPVVAPTDLLQDYDSTRQSYELFIPATSRATPKGKKTKLRPAAGLPMILFISPGEQPAGWNACQSICQQHGVVFASPFHAGNNTPAPKRIRIVLDVLDDIRRQVAIDPDRTYIGGFSGGGRIACGIGFALPELFGGIIPVCAAGELRQETWLKHRVIDRLSVAFLTGTADFNRGEVERFRGPLLQFAGVRTQITVVPHLGHAIPEAKVFTKTWDWLENALPARRQLAEKYPASRIEKETAPSREDFSNALFAEGQKRVADPKTTYSGLMQLQGVMNRWPDLEVSKKAREILLEYESRPDHPWEVDDIAEQRQSLIARARALSDYAMGDLPDQYAQQRKSMLEAALNLWGMVIQDGQDAKAVQEGRKRIPELEQKRDAED